jgi:hypothetical protein
MSARPGRLRIGDRVGVRGVPHVVAVDAERPAGRYAGAMLWRAMVDVRVILTAGTCSQHSAPSG